MENIKKYFPYVSFAYSFKDEISLLIDKEQIEHNKDFQNRIEKVLPLLSGYISSMFSQYIPKKLKTSTCEAFSFDARIIIIPTEKLKHYFHSRQAFAMSGFIDRICSFKHLSPISRTFSNVKQALKDIGDDWFNYPQYVCSGYVGRYENEKWTVDKEGSRFIADVPKDDGGFNYHQDTRRFKGDAVEQNGQTYTPANDIFNYGAKFRVTRKIVNGKATFAYSVSVYKDEQKTVGYTWGWTFTDISEDYGAAWDDCTKTVQMIWHNKGASGTYSNIRWAHTATPDWDAPVVD